jgi:hypothetical protein
MSLENNGMKKTLFLLPLFVLAACNKQVDVHTVQTKEWYMQHDAERHARVPECKNDAALQVTPDCQNALAAESQIFVFGK